MKLMVLAAGVITALATGAQEWHTLAGRIELLPGYVDRLRPGEFCYDSNCGEIWKNRGLVISYELNNGSYELEEDNDLATFVYCQDHVNGQLFEFSLEIDPGDKTQTLRISVPDEVIFTANVRGSADICKMMRMTVSYQGKNYRKTGSSGSLLCGGLRDEVGNFFGQMPVSLTNLQTHKRWETQTDDGGHFSFGSLLPGNYRLQSAAYKDELGCEYPARAWEIRVGKNERKLIYRRIVSTSKRIGCRDSD